MIVLPGVRRSGANAAGASASGRTAPTIGLSRPSLSRCARSASWQRSASTTKKTVRPSLGWTVGNLDDGDERAAGAHKRSRAVEDLAADYVEHHVNLAGVFPLVGLQVQEGIHSQAERCVAVRRPPCADHSGSDFTGGCTAIEPTPPAAPWNRTVWPVLRRAWSISPYHAVSPEIGRAAATVWSRQAGRGARLWASTAAYSAREPLRVQSVTPNTRRPQAAGRRPQAAGRRPQAAGRRPRRRPQAAGRRPQAAGRRPQAAGRRPQAAGRRPQAAGRRPQAAGRRPQAAGRRPQAAGRRPQAAGRRPQAAGRRPQAAGRRPQAAGRRPQAA